MGKTQPMSHLTTETVSSTVDSISLGWPVQGCKMGGIYGYRYATELLNNQRRDCLANIQYIKDNSFSTKNDWIQ